MDVNTLYIIIAIISGIAGASFTAGMTLGKYQSKEKCEIFRNGQMEKFKEEVSRVEKIISDDIKRIENSIIRIHERIDVLANCKNLKDG